MQAHQQRLIELTLELQESNSKLTQCQSAKQAADQRVLEMTQELENNAGNVYE